MKQTTALTQQDLRIYKSQRLTDTPDGGGMMTNQPLVGADNELFDPISDVDRTMGALDTRLIYPAVLRDDDEKLLGANVIVSQPPEANNASILIVPADFYGQERASIMERIEAYRVATVENRMTLWGTQLKGSRLVRVYQMISASIPVVGDVLALRVMINDKPVYDFIRIEQLSHSIDTFEINGVEFQRRVINIVTQQPLEHDFVGVERVSRDDVFPPARVMDTQIADSAKYYGIKPLAEPIVQGAASLKLPTIFEQLVPVSTVETPMADDWASGRLMWIETAPRRNVYSGSRLFQTGEKLHLECPVLPASVQIDGWQDDGLGYLVRGDKRLQIDYANGVISGFDGVHIGAVSAVPAVQVRNFAYSAAIAINETNIGTDFAPILRPRPARGSVAVDFIASGTWYQLHDNGDYILRDNQNRGRGQVTKNGSTVISLPVQPDANSHLLVSWTPQDFYHNHGGSEAGTAIEPSALMSVFSLPEKPIERIKPRSLRLNWNDGTAKTATDDGNGKLIGNVSGWVDYAGGKVYPDGLSAAAVQIRAEQYIGNLKRESAMVSHPDNDNIRLFAGKNIQRGTLSVHLSVGFFSESTDASGERFVVKMTTRDYQFLRALKAHRERLHDNGNGKLIWRGQVIEKSSVNYVTGEINLPKSIFATIEILLSRNETHRIHADAPPIESSMLIAGASGNPNIDDIVIDEQAEVSYVSAPDVRQITDDNIKQGSLTFDVLQGVAYPRIVTFNSWVFDIGGKRVIERDGTLYETFDALTGSGKVVGSLSETGILHFEQVSVAFQPIVKVLQGVYTQGEYKVKQFHSHTALAPVKPQSFVAYADLSETETLTGQSQADGNLSGSLKGKIDLKTGIFMIEAENPIPANLMRYNAVAQSTIPLDSTIIGINANRLPLDGKVPIYRKGDMIVIGNHLEQDIGSAHIAGQSIELQRKNLDRLCVLDADGKHINAELYDADLAAGRMTWATPLDLSQYKMPLKTKQVWEEENRITDVNVVSGSLKLQFGVSRNFPIENTFVSSAIVGGNMEVRATQPFSQKAWTEVWQDTRVGDPILANINTADYPIELTSDGAITERWLMKFTTNGTQFQLFGERLGLVAESDIYTDLAPINPATQKPYFKLPALAMGGGFATQNCVRFNTTGTPLPVWVVRAVQPSANREIKRDGFALCLRGNTIEK